MVNPTKSDHSFLHCFTQIVEKRYFSNYFLKSPRKSSIMKQNK